MRNRKISAKHINKAIVCLWEEYKERMTQPKWPLIYPNLTAGGLVVVGLNPALPNSPSYYEVPGFISGQKDQEVISLLAKKEKKAIETYSYFKQFINLAEHLCLSLQHVDLFFYRVSKQSDLEKVICKDNKVNRFGKEQLALSRELVELARPKILLVSNAFASRIFKDEYSLQIQSDEAGLYWTEINKKTVPVFLSSMLTGRHALDVFSRERLFWHMKKYLSGETEQ